MAKKPEDYMDPQDIAVGEGIGRALQKFRDQQTPVISQAFKTVWEDAKKYVAINHDVPNSVLAGLLGIDRSTINYWK